MENESHAEMALMLVNVVESAKVSALGFLGYWVSETREEELKIALKNYATKQCTREELRELWMQYNSSTSYIPMSFENFEMIYETT